MFWVVTGGLLHPVYKTPTVAPRPSVKWVAGASNSMGGRISTQMLLWIPPRDLVVRPWG
jgi:hypothetical protein